MAEHKKSEDRDKSIIKNKQKPIEEAFSKSLELVDIVKKHEEKSYIWFSNMKLPKSFKGEEVRKYYSNLLPKIKKFPKLEVRRIHLIFDEYFVENSNSDYKEQLKHLFIILLVERFMGIDSRVLNVKNYKEVKDKIFHFKEKNIDTSRTSLLDFALFYDGNDDNNLFQNHHTLFADFCFQRIDDADDFPFQTVYETKDYMIFHVLKAYYLSLWNKEPYIEYLKKYVNEILKVDESLKDINIKLLQKETNETIDVFSTNFEILDFFDYWKIISMLNIKLQGELTEDDTNKNSKKELNLIKELTEDMTNYNFSFYYSWEEFINNNKKFNGYDHDKLQKELFDKLNTHTIGRKHLKENESYLDDFKNNFKIYFLRDNIDNKIITKKISESYTIKVDTVEKIFDKLGFEKVSK